jgi:phosphatidylserine decarboxylase
VIEVVHKPGRFHAAFLDKASELNEQTAVLVEDTRGERVLFVQIAGQLASGRMSECATGSAMA